MPKTTDVPHELREFNKLFELISRRWDYSRVFDDFLTITLNFFLLFPKKLEWPSYERQDLDRFNALFQEFLLVMKRGIHEHKWYDALGTYYQVLSSNSKKSCMGQFFTPESVCSMMAQMTPIEGEGNFVNDPTCGSGRTLLAAHCLYPGNIFFGEDLDPMCCKMATINMLIHGVRGEVVNMDSLSRESFRAGWRVNRWLHLSGIPVIEEIGGAQSYMWSGHNCWDRGEVTGEVKEPVRIGQIEMAI